MAGLTVATYFTLLRFVLVPIFVATVVRGAYGWALVTFAVAAASDGVDGFIARRFNQRSRLGATLDPLADKLLLISAFVALTFVAGVPHRMPAYLTLPALARDAIIVVGVVALTYRYGWFDYEPHWLSKCNTVAQIAAVLIVILINRACGAQAVPQGWLVFETIVCVATLALIFVSLAAYVWTGTAILMGGPKGSPDGRPCPAGGMKEGSGGEQ